MKRAADLLDVLTQIEHVADRLARRGFRLDDVVAARNAEGLIPMYRVTVKNGIEEELWAYSDADLRRLREEAEARLGRPIDIEADAESGEFAWKEILSSHVLAKHLAALERKGFPPSALLKKETPLLFLADSEKKTPVHSLLDLLNAVREHGRKGLGIQRYKGLGEMNPEQLWETTLNPENRKLLQVRLESAAKAEEIFSTLMGDEVEPRRQFIEDNALNVRNLDV